MTIVTGGAKSARYGADAKGDQGQTSTPDFKGEVSMKEYTSEYSFYERYGGWIVVRPLSETHAANIAHLMQVACNNAHIGYKYGGTDMQCQGGGHLVDTTTDCWTDCSGLVSECCSEATSTRVYASTRYLVDTLVNTKLFTEIGPFKSYAATPVYNGDIIVKPGTHTELVVSGNPRGGTADEVMTNYSGMTTQNMVSLVYNYTVDKSFTPRRKEVESSEPAYSDYYDQAYGKNKNGSYAWGRFSEIIDAKCTLSTGQPRRWYLYTEDGYDRGTVPSLGAVMCYTNRYSGTDLGWVSIVEDVGDSYIYVSERNPSTGKFQYRKRKKTSYGTWDMDADNDGKYEYAFQGFIYNPAVNYSDLTSGKYTGNASKLTTFINEAKNSIGKGISYAIKYGGISSSNQAWAGAYIRAVASKTGGILNVIIPDTTACSAIGGRGVQQSMGEWLDGPCLGRSPYPQVGDIAFFRTNTSDTQYRLKYAADTAGIIIESDVGSTDSKTGKLKVTFKVAMGDCRNKVAEKTYTNISASLSGLYRPDWSKVDTIAISSQKITATYGVYTDDTSPSDACLRDFKYLNVGQTKGSGSSKITTYKPSITKTNLKLTAINYTGMLNNLYGAFAEMSEYLERRENQSDYIAILNDSTLGSSSIYQEDSGVVVLSGDNVEITGPGTVSYTIQNLYDPSKTIQKTIVLNSVVKTLYSSLTAYFKNEAGAIGVMGNIAIECDFDISVGSRSGGAGMCQWTDTRYDNLVKIAGSNWGTNLSGQIKFLEQELNASSFKSLRTTCQTCLLTLEGAYTACQSFMELFERSGVQEINGPNRKKATKALWTLLKGGS